MLFCKTKKSFNKRIYFLFYLFIFLFVLVFIQLFNIQVVQSQYWQDQADLQHFGKSVTPAERGTIYSKDKTPLVLNRYKYELYVDSELAIKNKEDINNVFNILYKNEDKEVREKKQDEWEELLEETKIAFLEKEVTEKVKREIENLDFNWLWFNPVIKRVYPEPFLYSHILGFVGKDSSGVSTGYYGIEGYYDGDLRGTDGYSLEEISALGSPILFGNYTNISPIDGSSIQLTIDRTMQSIAYEGLKKAVNDYDAESGTIVIINPRTGGVLSMVNYPSYNPLMFSHYYNEDNGDIFTNKAISEPYEPGSVVKPITMSAALDLGSISHETTMVDRGPVTYSDFEIDNWDGKHHGEISMNEVLQLSNNIGAAWVGDRVGRENLFKYFKKFSFGSKTNIDIQGEESGTIRNYKTWEDIDLATASFGQGFSVTPLQLTTAFGVIANEGKLMKPHIVDTIIHEDEEVKKEPELILNAINKETSRVLVQMLTKAVSSGEAKYFISDRYNVAGKTGTAQIYEDGEYLEDKTNTTFVGFLPSSKEFVMLVKLEKPKSSIYASETAVPAWMSIAEKLAVYLGIPPDKGD